jgi:hypothetical protein
MRVDKYKCILALLPRSSTRNHLLYTAVGLCLVILSNGSPKSSSFLIRLQLDSQVNIACCVLMQWSGVSCTHTCALCNDKANIPNQQPHCGKMEAILLSDNATLRNSRFSEKRRLFQKSSMHQTSKIVMVLHQPRQVSKMMVHLFEHPRLTCRKRA